MTKYQDKKNLIINSAMELFKEKGYSNTRIIDISKKAGIGKGTVYVYFSSKEDIITEIIRNIAENDFGECGNGFDSNDSIENNIINYLSVYEKVIEKYGIYAIAFKEQICFEKDVNSGEILKLLDEVHNKQYRIIESILKKGVDNGEIVNANLEQAAMFALTVIGSYMFARLIALEERAVSPPGTEIYKNMTKENLAGFIIYGICGRKEK